MQARLRALVFSLAGAFYLAAGTYSASHFSADFIPVYAGARCMMHGCNPYDSRQLEQQYLEGHGARKLITPTTWTDRPSVYPPSTFVAVFPLAWLNFKVAAVLWALLSGSALILATAFVISVTSRADSWIPTLLGSFILIVSWRLLDYGNPATFACSLAIIGTLLFLIGRHVPTGAILLALSLALKPQVVGLIILYLLVRGVYRGWAMLSLTLGLGFLLAGVLMLQMHPGDHGWMQTLHANIAECVQPGHVNDPSPANKRGGLLNLQTLTSIFLSNPKAADAVAVGITLFLFLLWIFVVWKLEARRSAMEPPNHFLVLPPLLVLLLLPVYHSSFDARVLLLSIPMTVIVMQSHKALGIALAVVTAFPFFFESFSRFIMMSGGRFGHLAGFLSSKAAFFILLRAWCPELLLLFGLQLAALWRYQANPVSHQALISSVSPQSFQAT